MHYKDDEIFVRWFLVTGAFAGAIIFMTNIVDQLEIQIVKMILTLTTAAVVAMIKVIIRKVKRMKALEKEVQQKCKNYVSYSKNGAEDNNNKKTA